jgi:hypothetical protein
MSTLYRGPLGNSALNPDFAFLQPIAAEPAGYWQTGGGYSCLETKQGSGTYSPNMVASQPCSVVVVGTPIYWKSGQ